MEEKTSERHASDLLIACSAGHFGRHHTQAYSPTHPLTQGCSRVLTGARWRCAHSRTGRSAAPLARSEEWRSRTRRFVCSFRWNEPEGSAAMARRERVRSLCCNMLHCARCVATCCNTLHCAERAETRHDERRAAHSRATRGRGSLNRGESAVACASSSALPVVVPVEQTNTQTNKQREATQSRTADRLQSRCEPETNDVPPCCNVPRCVATWCAALQRAALRCNVPALAIRSDPARSIMFSTPTDVAPSASCVRIRSCSECACLWPTDPLQQRELPDLDRLSIHRTAEQAACRASDPCGVGRHDAVAASATSGRGVLCCPTGGAHRTSDAW